ncbi:MAG: hypothetical protein MK102_12415 [Fuerstiella sp.]|nr:hypothetical protein [Fuerstiella sp.]
MILRLLRKLPTIPQNIVLVDVADTARCTRDLIRFYMVIVVCAFVPVLSTSDDAVAHDGELTSVTQPETDDSPRPELREMSDIRPSFDYAWGDVEESALPDDFSKNTDDQKFTRVIGTPTRLHWQPSNLWYHPLYFEDPALERYGHTHDPLLQTLVSTGRFVGQAATLPYNATLRPKGSREYPLGWYRPGESVPYLTYLPPWNDEAAANQALAVMGLVFLFP